jgi:TolA-binding protein
LHLPRLLIILLPVARQVPPPVVLRLGPQLPPSPAASSEPGDPAKEKLYYDAAFDLIKAKDFDKASQAFTAFLRKYPNSQYAGNAQYWLGEVNLAKGDLQGCRPGICQGQPAVPQARQGAGFAVQTR